MECNPATADTSKLKKCRKAGVNRLSIGIQSASDAELHELSRIHTWSDAVACYNDARRAGFDNINLDIMYGIPLQTPDSLRDTLDAVTDLDPEHISLYCLKLEDGERLWRAIAIGSRCPMTIRWQICISTRLICSYRAAMISMR